MNNIKSIWQPAYLGIGSNLQDPSTQVQAAFDALAELADSSLIAVSGLYSNPPMGPQDQPDYINAAAGLLTRLEPAALLNAMKHIEQRLGRVRKSGDRWGARIIDLDLLVYGTVVLEQEGLTIPHPGIFERNFVLFPLLDIAPQLIIPGQGSVEVLAQRFADSAIQRLED
jgi:2-amino-4-hydroxy-6-hydroxymethyldihydropteridine diphosphokinase